MSGKEEVRKGKSGQKPARLDKLLSREGLGTRSEVRRMVRAGRVLVDGAPEKDPGRQVTEEAEILFDGARVGQAEHVYYMLNKPAGVITATQDDRHRTVMDLLQTPEDGSAPVLRRGLSPVGRLDRDTEGLLLITDDGQLAHRLLAPGRHVDKTYYALVTGHVTQDEIRLFAQGLAVDGEFTALPAILQVVGQKEEQEMLQALVPAEPERFLLPEVTEYTQTFVTIREGKFHQIKRMFAALGKEVLYLKRLSMGSLTLDPSLRPGQFRGLTEEEIRGLDAKQQENSPPGRARCGMR